LYFYILERRRPSSQLVSGRAWSASAATIRTRKMTTRRRDRASEDEPAKSDNGRTGADPEEANQTTLPSGSLHQEQLSAYFHVITAEKNVAHLAAMAGGHVTAVLKAKDSATLKRKAEETAGRD
ncbi:hypothetical protein T12_5165, partial [Trichinella patagoniensis]